MLELKFESLTKPKALQILFIFRTINLHPICLPKWNVYDIEGKPTNTRLYKSIQWENYQRLYSLKALHKDIRFSNVWTDVNGPSKFLVQCTLDLVTLLVCQKTVTKSCSITELITPPIAKIAKKGKNIL